MNEILTITLALTAMGIGLFAAGWLYGYAKGRERNDAWWREHMIGLGLAGYNHRTGVWEWDETPVPEPVLLTEQQANGIDHDIRSLSLERIMAQRAVESAFE